MKKTVCLLLLVTLPFGMMACGASQSVSTGESPFLSAMPSPSIPPSLSPAPTLSPTLSEPKASSGDQLIASPDADDLSFSDLSGLEFYFESGVGAWSTMVKIMSDGAFSGYYSDSNMGETGVGYPNGTLYKCNFSGSFTTPVKTGDYEYMMKCEALATEGTVDEEEIVDGVRVITSTPYGFDNADEFMVYLPGKKLSELPDEFLLWVHINPESIDPEGSDALTFYGLYNVGGQEGFSGY